MPGLNPNHKTGNLSLNNFPDPKPNLRIHCLASFWVMSMNRICSISTKTTDPDMVFGASGA